MITVQPIVVPERRPPQWWVSKGPDGSYSRHTHRSSLFDVGPFATSDSADAKAVELNRRAASHRALIRAGLICLAIMVAVTALLKILP